MLGNNPIKIMIITQGKQQSNGVQWKESMMIHHILNVVYYVKYNLTPTDIKYH